VLGKLLKSTSLPVESSSGNSTGIPNTGEVGSEAKLPELQKIKGKSEIKPTGGFFGKLLAKPPASTTNPEGALVKSKATEKNAALDPSTEAANSSEETAKLLNFRDLPENLQNSLKFLSAENKEKIQAIEVESESPEVKNYQIMFTGKAAKQLFLNTFQKILHGMNLFGKSDAPDQTAKLVTASDRDRSYLSKALANNSAYLQAQFSVPVDVRKKAEIKDISITESPFNLQKLLLERKDLTEVVLNAAKQIIQEQPNISIKADLEAIIKALENKDKEALKAALEPFARTYSLEALKASPEANQAQSILKDSTNALIAQGVSKEGLNATVVISGTEAKPPTITDAIAIQDVLLPSQDGTFNPGELTIVNKNNNSIPSLIFYTLLTMADFTRAGKTLNKEESKALTEAIVKSTINADAQAKAAVAHLN
jgi:hypothetical protein